MFSYKRDYEIYEVVIVQFKIPIRKDEISVLKVIKMPIN